MLTNVNEKSVVIDYEGQPFLGEASAPVEIVEFGDYKCPSCKDFNDRLFPVIYQELVETGKAKFYFMNYSFIAPDSTTAAQFAETVYKELGNESFGHSITCCLPIRRRISVKQTLLNDVSLEDMLESSRKRKREGDGGLR